MNVWQPGTSASSRPMSRFKMQMQKGERWFSTPGWIFVAGTCIWDNHDKPYCQYCTLYARNLSDQDSSTLYPLAEHLGRRHVFVVLIVECTFSETVCVYMACSVLQLGCRWCLSSRTLCIYRLQNMLHGYWYGYRIRYVSDTHLLKKHWYGDTVRIINNYI